jgi:hypothetical protein
MPGKPSNGFYAGIAELLGRIANVCRVYTNFTMVQYKLVARVGGGILTGLNRGLNTTLGGGGWLRKIIPRGVWAFQKTVGVVQKKSLGGCGAGKKSARGWGAMVGEKGGQWCVAWEK